MFLLHGNYIRSMCQIDTVAGNVCAFSIKSYMQIMCLCAKAGKASHANRIAKVCVGVIQISTQSSYFYASLNADSFLSLFLFLFFIRVIKLWKGREKKSVECETFFFHGVSNPSFRYSSHSNRLN